MKDNRLLPHGFDKAGGVEGHCGGRRARRRTPTSPARATGCATPIPVAGEGPFTVEAELLYQPIGYRWANNLKKYDAAEPRRFNGYYDAMGAATTAVLGAVRSRQH